MLKFYVFLQQFSTFGAKPLHFWVYPIKPYAFQIKPSITGHHDVIFLSQFGFPQYNFFCILFLIFPPNPILLSLFTGNVVISSDVLSQKICFARVPFKDKFRCNSNCMPITVIKIFLDLNVHQLKTNRYSQRSQ